jgi:hypothetical protein
VNLISLYLPLRDNSGNALDADLFKAVEQELSERFGGVTAHMQAPASGLWRQGNVTHADDIVIFDVMVDNVDQSWWTGYRHRLEKAFRQKTVLILCHKVDVL